MYVKIIYMLPDCSSKSEMKRYMVFHFRKKQYLFYFITILLYQDYVNHYH